MGLQLLNRHVNATMAGLEAFSVLNNQPSTEELSLPPKAECGVDETRLQAIWTDERSDSARSGMQANHSLQERP
jgi:hypothetical protein